MTIFRSFFPSPREDNGETLIGFFSSEHVAKEISGKEYQAGSFIVEPVEVIENVEDFYRNKKREIAKNVFSGFSPEVQAALIEYIIEAASKNS